MLKKIAFSKVLLPSGEVLTKEIVEFDDNNRPVRHYGLKEEQPFVEWRDTTYVYQEPQMPPAKDHL